MIEWFAILPLLPLAGLIGYSMGRGHAANEAEKSRIERRILELESQMRMRGLK